MKKFFIWLKDYWCMLRGMAAMFVLVKPPKHYLGYVVRKKCPIIVLPGILERWAFMLPIINELSLKGHPIYVIPKLKNNLLDIPFSARLVKEFIEDEKIENAVIVAHSKGGLIGKYLLAYFNKKGHVKGMVSLATPYSGSAMAKLISRDAFLELLPDSQIIRKLKKRKKINKKIISVYPSYDNHIWSDAGSYLEGALDNIVVEENGHHRIIYNKEVREIIQKSIARIMKL